jgi:tRNA pseudouridine38-40 synthase
MPRYRLVIEYDGSDFHGWQVQPGARTVQGEIERALATLLGAPVRIAGAGRTDAGVHASGQVIAFSAATALEPEVLQRALNALTGEDLAVRAVASVDEGFDPRRAARARRYVYRIWNRRQASPFWRRYTWHIPAPLDTAAMAAAAMQLKGTQDFSSFRASGCDAAQPVRQVFYSRVVTDGVLVRYEIEATAFLRHMVRNIVGTLVEIGHRRRSTDLSALLSARDRTQAGATAPACGLCLEAVRY